VTLWSGRFSESPDEAMWRFTVDTSDRRLLVDDVVGSRAHATMLGVVGLVSSEDAEALRRGLESILDEAVAGTFPFEAGDEDVHSAVERRLYELVGEVAGKLHTGRSRNDQVCLDLRLYLRRAALDRIEQLRGLVGVLVEKAASAGEAVVPAYTHLQQAQAIPLGHHLLAYAWMLLRDAERFQDALGRIAVSPLGAGASAGSSLPLDPWVVADELGLHAVFENSLDAVASRDFVAEYAFCCAQGMVHLSRFAEELVLWSTTEFGWVTFTDRHTTGSSALPHKKNPDIAELVRGRAAPVIGDVTALLALQKGLPLAYDRDLQEDKAAVFHADDTLSGALEALAGMVAAAGFHPPAPSSWVTALDLAEVLVSRGVPFREAHRLVGGLVSDLVAEGRTLADVTAGELAAVDPRLVPADLAALSPAESVRRRHTPGGGSHESVRVQVAELRAILSRWDEDEADDEDDEGLDDL
jgi:argininosuccinate lyase